MLANVRRAYLAVEAGPSTYLQRNASVTFDPSNSDEQWTSIRHLTNEERDQIDLQARIILSKCADRVKQLEALEKSTSYNVFKTNTMAHSLPLRTQIIGFVG